MWGKYDGRGLRGLMIEGDKTVRPTTLLNVVWMKFWGWKTVVVFTLSAADAERGYRLGFRAHDGICLVNSTVYHDRLIAMRVGHEDCTFLALASDGAEITFVAHERSTKKDAKRIGIRLV